MRLDQLLYFVDIAETHSINQSAANYFISHQAISSAIKKLEREINATLLIRTKTGVCLTEDGEYFLHQAKQIIEIYNDTLQHFKKNQYKFEEPSAKQLNIYVPPRIMDTFMPAHVNNFLRKNPEVNLSIKCKEASSILHDCDFKSDSVAILAIHDKVLHSESFNTLLQQKKLQLKIIKREKLYVCLSKASKWADLKFEYHEGENAGLYQIPIVGFDYNLFSENERKFDMVYQVNTLHAQKNFLLENRGVAVITKREFNNYFRNKRLMLKEYENYFSLNFCYIVGPNTSKTVETFVNNLKL